MIHKAGDQYVISSNHVWRPGAYDSERTARYAFRFSDRELQQLQDSLGQSGVITLEMLQCLWQYRKTVEAR